MPRRQDQPRAITTGPNDVRLTAAKRAVTTRGGGHRETSLVREAAGAARADGHHVLFGQCLRFGADVTSYVPFTQALTPTGFEPRRARAVLGWHRAAVWMTSFPP